MTNVLLITNKKDITTDFIVKQLAQRRISYYRLNTEEIGGTIQIGLHISAGEYTLVDTVQNITIDLLQVKAVYFRRPEINTGFTSVTAAEVNFLKSELLFTLEGLYKILKNAFWLNHIDAIRNAENKIYQLMLATEIGFTIPNSLVTNHPSAGLSFYQTNDDKTTTRRLRFDRRRLVRLA